MIKKALFAAFSAALISLGAFALSTDDAVSADAAIIAQQAPDYPLDTCVVSGEKFTKEAPAVDVVVNGQLLRTCCKKCVAVIRKDPTAATAKVHAAVVKAQKSSWPLNTCPVSGEAYGGDMGEPIDFVVGTRYVKLCCGGCLKSVKKDPTKFLAKLDALAMPELAKTYPIKTCMVSGEALGSMGAPIDVMYGHRLLRFCCKGCLKAYKKDPAGTAKKVYAAK
ncbi:MAG: hypothetical protein ACI8X5_001644 [Planctomycetota bacterium]|jgi:hypothetical protein